MHAITEGSAARIGDSRVRSTQMAEEDKWIVGSRNSASGLLVRPNLLLIIAHGSSWPDQLSNQLHIHAVKRTGRGPSFWGAQCGRTARPPSGPGLRDVPYERRRREQVTKSEHGDELEALPK